MAVDIGLRNIRENCAEGKVPSLIPDYLPPERVCLTVIEEAVSRGQQADLYSQIQPGKAGDEFNLIVAASGRNEPHYANVTGVKRELPCELAFDAGFVWALLNQQTEAVEPTIGDDQIRLGTTQCFDPDVNVGSYTGLVAGARISRRYLGLQ